MKKQLRIAAFIVLAAAAVFTGCDNNPADGSGNGDQTAEYQELVSLDKADLKIIYGGTEDASAVTRNIMLPIYGDRDTIVSWASSDTSLIYWTENNIGYCAINGNVERPAFSDGNKTVTLTATITKGTVSDTKDFVLTVLKMPGTDYQSVQDDVSNLEVQYALGDSASSVTQNIFLETDGNCGTVISWSSSNAAVILNDGTVIRPAFLNGDESVTLTATVSKGSASETRTFVLTVIETPPTDAQAVAEDLSALAIIYAAGDSADHVTQNVTLPATGTCGTAVTWSSSNISVISASGLVTVLSTQISVTLTATVSKGSSSDTREFILLVGNYCTFNTAANIGDSVLVSIVGENIEFAYVNNSSSDVVFPMEIDDSGTGTITEKFFMGKTEIPNSLVIKILQWAYDNGKFSSNINDHNGLDSNRAKYGGQDLIIFFNTLSRIRFSSGVFSVDNGFENCPAHRISMYGAIMLCNWLTEMQDGNTDNIVYTGIDTTWIYSETVENVSKTGYRLPTNKEWEYAARYRGSDSTNTVSGYSNPYYTKGNSISGATTYYNDISGAPDYAGKLANDLVAVLGGYWNGSENIATGVASEAEIMSKGPDGANALGLYDMSGNIPEWCFEIWGVNAVYRGGYYKNPNPYWAQIGLVVNSLPTDSYWGFRLARTK